MTNYFLRSKHWQLFIPMYGIPILGGIVFMGYSMKKAIQISMEAERNPYAPPSQMAQENIQEMFNGTWLMMLVSMIGIALFFLWMRSVITGLKDRVPSDVPMKYGRFNIFWGFSFIYLMLFYLLMIMFFSLMGNIDIDNPPAMNIDPDAFVPIMFALMFPLHLFAIFCMFFCFVFVAKLMKTVQLQEPVVFKDFMEEFFLIWFFFIGVWILQPKLNRLVDKEHEKFQEEFGEEEI